MSNADLTTELRAFCDDYMLRFNSADVTQWNDCFDFPWVTVNNSELTSVENATAGVALFEQFGAALKAEGWVRTAIDIIEARGAGRDGATMIIGFRRLDGAGALLQAGNACYQMRRRGDRWKIATIVDAFSG